MRYLLILLAFAFPAIADTFNCTGATAAFSCVPTNAPPATCAPPEPAKVTAACPAGQTGSITTTYACVGTTWTPTTVTACTAAPLPPGQYVPISLGQESQNHSITMQQDTAYAGGLPVPKGQFSMTVKPDSPGGVQIEIGISPQAGDFTWYKTPAACYIQFGSKQCPCGTIANPESAGVKWGPVIVSNDTVCVIPSGYFVNFRMLGGSGPMFFAWQHQ